MLKITVYPRNNIHALSALSKSGSGGSQSVQPEVFKSTEALRDYLQSLDLPRLV